MRTKGADQSEQANPRESGHREYEDLTPLTNREETSTDET